jgi:catechol 2,3-dioxygenase-like lactoylglutathione lyase family enzyme
MPLLGLEAFRQDEKFRTEKRLSITALHKKGTRMITRLSHATIYCFDQDEALQFYRDKLGFEVRTDFSMDNGFRWLTVGPKTQPDLEIVLMKVSEGFMFDAEKVAMMKQLIEGGAMGAGVMEVDDCKETYQELRAKGVEFLSEPEERFYGIEALFKDNSGNWFSMTQRAKKPAG